MDEFKYNIREEDDEHFIPSNTVSMSSIDRSEILIAVPNSFSLTDGISKDTIDFSTTEKSPSALDAYQQAPYGSQETKGKRFLRYDNRKIYNKKYDLSLNDFADLLSPVPSSSDNGISGSGSHDLNDGPIVSKSETFPVADLSEDLVTLSEMTDNNKSSHTSEVETVPVPTVGTGLVGAAVNRIKRSFSITKTPLGEEQQPQQQQQQQQQGHVVYNRNNQQQLQRGRGRRPNLGRRNHYPARVKGAAIDTTNEENYNKDIKDHKYEQSYNKAYTEDDEWEPDPGSI
jgi:hypothetical protein